MFVLSPRRSFSKFAFAPLLALALWGPVADAGVVLQIKSVGQNGNADTLGTMTVDGVKVRIEQPVAGSRQNVSMIFRPKKKEMHALDANRKLDQVIDAASVAQIKTMQSQMEDMMKMQMAKAPPEQKKAMQQMLDQQQKAKDAKKVKSIFKKTKETKKVLGKVCTRWDVFSGKTLTRSMWVAPRGSFKGEKEAVDGLTAVATFMEELMADFPQAGSENFPFEGLAKMGGLPLEIVSYNGKTIRSIDLITAVKVRKVDAATFETPAGFTRQTLADQLKRGIPPGAQPGAPGVGERRGH
ncbi:MAG: hypothetical protein GY822_02760 [Deltaproteobacteria bacterium]|nr:hypothetical protein [Deltaproteobacteria bacterium]